MSAGKRPSVQLLFNETKTVAQPRFLATSSEAKRSTFEGFMCWLGRFSPINLPVKRQYLERFSSEGFQMWIEVCGFGKEDLKLEIKNQYLLINGVAKNRLGKEIKISEKVAINPYFMYDPENVWAEMHHGLLHVRFPFSENREDMEKKGTFGVKWM
ncbi:hypothetical protein Tco_0233226 [Tanacetum coccineum]